MQTRTHLGRQLAWLVTIRACNLYKGDKAYNNFIAIICVDSANSLMPNSHRHKTEGKTLFVAVAFWNALYDWYADGRFKAAMIRVHLV